MASLAFSGRKATESRIKASRVLQHCCCQHLSCRHISLESRWWCFDYDKEKALAPQGTFFQWPSSSIFGDWKTMVFFMKADLALGKSSVFCPVGFLSMQMLCDRCRKKALKAPAKKREWILSESSTSGLALMSSSRLLFSSLC